MTDTKEKAKRLLTASRLRVARACRRQHRIEYILGYRPLEDAAALRFGSIIHKCLEAWWLMPKGMRLASALGALPADIDPFDRARAVAMMTAYDARWGLETYEVLGVEVEFETELRNPSTGRPSSVWDGLSGKMDVLVKDVAGRTLIIEHKTTTGDVGPGSDYWKKLRMDGQISVYFEGARSLGHSVSGCLYDVLAKPQLRPYQPGKTRKEAETPQEFLVRLTEAYAEDPGKYFQRGEVARLESEMTEALQDIWDLAQELHEAEKAGRAPRNPDACNRWNRMCQWFEVCTGTASLDDPQRFKRLNEVHPELSQQELHS